MKCYVCNSESIKQYKEVIYSHKSIQTYLCPYCNLIWVDDIDIDLLNAFYNKEYYSCESRIGYKDYLAEEKIHRLNAQYILKKINNILSLENKLILDYGCAYGFLLDEAEKKFRAKSYGIEISDFSYNYAKNVLNLNVYKDLNDLAAKNIIFDVVFVIGTIEHLVDPYETLKKINNVISSDGLIVVTTIDTKGCFPFYSLKPPEHLFYFNRRNLLILLKKIGLDENLYSIRYAFYSLVDVFFRLSEFFNNIILKYIFKFLSKSGINLKIKIPTNEMLVVYKKQNGSSVI